MEMNHAISEQINLAVSRQQTDLLNNLERMIDLRLSNFKQNIQQILSSQINRIEENLNEHYVFRRKGNENKFKHEARVSSKLKEANEHLNSNTVNEEMVEVAKSSINEGMELVKKRQKLIKLADSSQLGWKVIKEYETNPIAADSDDDKKMYRAQMRAERKVRGIEFPGDCLTDSRLITRSPWQRLQREWRQMASQQHQLNRADVTTVGQGATGAGTVQEKMSLTR